MNNTSCSVHAASVLLACKPEVIELILAQRDVASVLFKEIEYLELIIQEKDKKIQSLCNDIKFTIKKYE